MYRHVSRLLGIVCVVISLVGFSARASVAVRPHSTSGTAHFVSPTDFVGAGRATHLGRYTEVGSVLFSPTGDPAVLHVDGSAVYAASNGDELHAVITGELNGLTGVISATVTYVGGTGRFAAASGSAALSGQILSDGTLAVTVHGTIDY